MAAIDLWRFQRDLVNNPALRIVACWARGNGKTLVVATKIVLECFWRLAGCPEEGYAGASTSPIADWLIVSASAEQAKEALSQCAKMAKFFWAVGKEFEIEEEEVDNGREKYTLFRVWVGKGIKIQALACSPASVRGYTANVWWDEACFFADDREMFAAVSNCTRGRGRMIVTSTPFGSRECKFYEILYGNIVSPTTGQPLWSQSIADIHEAVAQGRSFDIAEEKAVADSDKWAREMELQWIEDGGCWFDAELLARATHPMAQLDGSGYQGGRVYLGNDIGIRGDRWCLWALEEVGSLLVTREVTFIAQGKFTEHDEAIARAFAKYKVVRLCMDQGGLGERSTEAMIDLYGADRVEGIIANANNKADMAISSKKSLNDGHVLLPDSAEIRRDFAKVRKSTSPGGSVRFSAQRDKHGHADGASAFMLAYNAAWVGVDDGLAGIVMERETESAYREAFDVAAGFLLR